MPQVIHKSSSELWFQVDSVDIHKSIEHQLKSDNHAFEDPIAQALKVLGKYRMVMVGAFSISAFKGPIKHEWAILNSEVTWPFLKDWMHGKPIEPIEVHLFLESQINYNERTSRRVPKNVLVNREKGTPYAPGF